MYSRIDNKTYHANVKQDYDVKEGYFYYIELPNDLISELGWSEGDRVNTSVKLGNKGNVIVVNKT